MQEAEVHEHLLDYDILLANSLNHGRKIQGCSFLETLSEVLGGAHFFHLGLDTYLREPIRHVLELLHYVNIVGVVLDRLVDFCMRWVHVGFVTDTDIVGIVHPALTSLILSTGWRLQEEYFDPLWVL